jgi:hypothetical protein
MKLLKVVPGIFVSVVLCACAAGGSEQTVTENSPFGKMTYSIKSSSSNGVSQYSVKCLTAATGACLLYAEDRASGKSSKLRLAPGDDTQVPAGQSFCVQLLVPAMPDAIVCKPQS